LIQRITDFLEPRSLEVIRGVVVMQSNNKVMFTLQPKVFVLDGNSKHLFEYLFGNTISKEDRVTFNKHR
jgi:hypothetical protein